jgi:SulP family sulfate permease
MSSSASLRRWLPFLSWPRPGAAQLRADALAGFTVALVMVPQSVAYAGLAGMPLITGLYAALIPALLAALFGNSTRLSVGPAALSCLLVFASLSPLAEPGSAPWVSLAVWLALLSGLMQFALGAARLGWVLNLISAPVLTGFTQAAVLLIIASQLPPLLGLRGPLGSLWSAPQFDLRELGFGLACLGLILLGRRLAPRLPAIMLVAALAAVVSAVVGFERLGGAVIGALPTGWPSLYWPDFPGWATLGQLLIPAFVIALVSFLETTSSAKIEAQRDGRIWRDNQDLVAQGLAKMASGLSGSFPTSASFSRSALMLYAGARSGWAVVACTLTIALTLWLLTSALHHVPRATLAAIVVAAIVSLVQPASIQRLWRIGRVEALIALATFAITLASAPHIHWGVVAGVLMSLTHFLYHRLHPRIIEIGLHPDGSLRDRHLWKLPPLAPRLYALRMDDELDFASASAFERNITVHLAAHPGTRHVCLFAQPINRIDISGVEVFMQLRERLATLGVTLHISGIKLPVERVLLRAGALQPGELLQMYRTDAEALQALSRLQ